MTTFDQELTGRYVAAGGDHDDWDEYDRVMAAERRTAVLVVPRRVTGVSAKLHRKITNAIKQSRSVNLLP